MQMRYQLRHSPIVLLLPLRETTRGILANRSARCEIGGPAPGPLGQSLMFSAETLPQNVRFPRWAGETAAARHPTTRL